MISKNPDEKIKNLDEKIRQLQSQKELLLKKFKEKDRKKRTSNLIKIGVIMNTLGMETLDQANAFKKELKENSKFLEWFNLLMKKFELKENSLEEISPKENYLEENKKEKI